MRAGHEVNGKEPFDKTGAAAFHDSPGSKGSLMPAQLTFKQRQLAGRRHIGEPAIAAGTVKSLWPFHLEERLCAGGFGAESTLKFFKVNDLLYANRPTSISLATCSLYQTNIRM
jgi:hypothetical protein